MWDPPCLSLGKRQPINGVDLEHCRTDGVSVVRRVTGGWAILHTEELTYSIAARPDDPRADGAILDAYRKLSQGLVVGLSLLGAPAVMNPVALGGTQNLSAACFEVPSAYEITVGQRKLIGSAQTRPAGRVLQHGSLPLTGDIARVTDYLWFESEDARIELRNHLHERATTLSVALGRPVGFDEAADAMAAGFATALSLDLAPGALSADERAAVEALLPTKALEYPVSASAS
jgi:lipoate-protein ligase A